MRARLAGIAVLLGCRPPAAPAPAPVVVASPEMTQAPEPTPAPAPMPGAEPPEPAAASPEPVPLPPPPPLVPLELPFRADAIVVKPFADFGQTVLFRDEGDAVRRKVARFLAGKGKRLVPMKELERIEKAAADGRLVLEGNQRCRAALTREDVFARYFAGHRRASPSSMCDSDCRLIVDVDDPADPDASVMWASKTIPRPWDPRAYVAAVATLSTKRTILGGIAGGLMGMSHPPPIMIGVLDPIGPWDKRPDGSSLTAIAGALSGCAHPDPLVGFDWEARVAVARDGTVARCEATTDHSQARAADARCLCSLIEGVTYPKGRAGRRYTLQLTDTGGFRPDSQRFGEVQAGTAAWVRRVDESPAVAQCDNEQPRPSNLHATVILTLGPDGAIENAEIHGHFTTQSDFNWARCMTRELATVDLPCRPPGIDRLYVQLPAGK